MKALVFGAGAIGNHLSYSLRKQGYLVEVVDIDRLALQRMRESIYPARYGKWDDSINLVETPSDDFVDLEKTLFVLE